jgi:HlyD family secretion protein
MNKTLKYLLVSFGVLVLLTWGARKAGWIGKSEGMPVTTEVATNRSLIETVTASGKIQPEAEVKLSPEVSGEIIELTVREGERVSKGALLIRINPDIYQAAVSRAEAAVSSARAVEAQAKAQLVEASNNFNRNKSLFESKVISEQEFDAFQRAYDVARLGVESATFQLRSAEATAREAKDNLRRTTLYAPVDGTISKLSVEVGERVVGTAQMAGTDLLRIANLDRMEVRVDVNENDIVRVSIGDTAIVEADAYPGRSFRGLVTEIANSAKSDQGSVDQVTNFQVRVHILRESYADLIDIAKGPSPFRPGMSAAVEIRTAYRNDVVTVPVQAVTLRDNPDRNAPSQDQKMEVVFVHEAGRAVMKSVKTGIQDINHIEISSGIASGEEVITGPYTTVSRTLKADATVKATPRKVDQP